jgi:hypothetical protein
MRLAFIVLSGFHLSIELSRMSNFFMVWNSAFKEWNQVCHVSHLVRVVLILTKDSATLALILNLSYCFMNQASVLRLPNAHLDFILLTPFKISVASAMRVVTNVSPILDFAHNVKMVIF